MAGHWQLLIFRCLWSHPPGLNRRPADYETNRSSQTAEKTDNEDEPRMPIMPVSADVEQVSEQVALPTPSKRFQYVVEQDHALDARSWGSGTHRRSSLESVGSFVKKSHPELIISKQRFRQVEGLELVRNKRDQGKQTLCFSARPFVLCGLPVRKPADGELIYERRNGQFVLQVTGHPNFGVPFGQDRIVPIFLATLAVRQKSQIIRFKTAAEMLETFGMHKGGKEYRRLVAAFERIFGATMFFGTDSTAPRAKVVQRSRFNFLREAQIWYNKRPDQQLLGEEFENIIVLSDEFYHEVLAHPIPTDLEAVKVLASAPAVLDLFMWLVYRCFVAKGPELIPIFGSCGLVRQIGSVEYSRERRFLAKLEQWLNTIRVMWPGCPARIADHRALRIDHASGILPDAVNRSESC